MKEYVSLMRDYVKDICKIECSICAKYRCGIVKALESENKLAILTGNTITN